MRRALATLWLLLLAACGTAPTVTCGSSTCGPTQYCRNTCLCCGTPGGTPSGKSECVAIPAGCSALDLCSCGSLGSGSCNSTTRTVDVPCA